MIALAACGGGGSPAETPTAPPPPVTPPAPLITNITTETQGAQYAKVQTVAMDTLSAEFDVTKPAQISVSGAIRAAFLDGAQLRFITDSDRGKGLEGKVVLTQDNKAFNVPIQVISKQVFEPVVYAEADEESPLKIYPALKLLGLAEGNALTTGEFRFALEGMPAVDQNDKKFIVYSETTHTVYNLTQYLSFDPAAKGFYVSAANMSALLATLPAGEFKASTMFMVGDKVEPVIYEYSLSKSSASMMGSVVDSAGAALTGLTNHYLSVSSYNGAFRVLVAPDAAGKFNLPAVPPGTYDVRLYGATLQTVAAAAVPVYAGAKSVEVQLKIPSKATAAQGKVSIASATSGEGRTPQAAPVQSGDVQRPAGRGIAGKTVMAAATSNACQPYTSGGKTMVSAVSANEDQRMACQVNITVPKGTKEIRVTADVSTAEYLSLIHI